MNVFCKKWSHEILYSHKVNTEPDQTNYTALSPVQSVTEADQWMGLDVRRTIQIDSLPTQSDSQSNCVIHYGYPQWNDKTKKKMTKSLSLFLPSFQLSNIIRLGLNTKGNSHDAW